MRESIFLLSTAWRNFIDHEETMIRKFEIIFRNYLVSTQHMDTAILWTRLSISKLCLQFWNRLQGTSLIEIWLGHCIDVKFPDNFELLTWLARMILTLTSCLILFAVGYVHRTAPRKDLANEHTQTWYFRKCDVLSNRYLKYNEIFIFWVIKIGDLTEF